MTELPALKRLLIFRDPRLPFADLDFSDATTGSALAGCCLIGPNGIGKTTILGYLQALLSGRPYPDSEDHPGFLLAKFGSSEGDFYYARSASVSDGNFFQVDIEKSDFWKKRTDPSLDLAAFNTALSKYILPNPSISPFLRDHCLWLGESCDLDGVRQTEDFPAFLQSLTRRREECFHQFLRDPQNRDKTVAEVEVAFETESPEALLHLRSIWQRLLASTGIQVDFSAPQGPFLVKSGESALPRLGGAIQRLLLRSAFVLAHVQRAVVAGTSPIRLFCDSPELALHPRLVMDYFAFLRTPIQSSELHSPILYLATHSPELAASFSPEQRLRLDSDSAGSLITIRSKDRDFDRILQRDFGMENIVASPSPSRDSDTTHRHTQRLKRAIRESEKEDELANLIDEMISLGKR